MRTVLKAWFDLVPSLAATGAAPAEAGLLRHNIIVILADNLGYGDLSCYGATKLRMPDFDRLAQ